MDKAFDSGECAHIIEGEVKMGGQEHFYLEPQGSVIIPLENDEMVVISSTQVTHSRQVLESPSGVAVGAVKQLSTGFSRKSPILLQRLQKPSHGILNKVVSSGAHTE